MISTQEAPAKQITQDSEELSIQSDMVESAEVRKELAAEFSRKIISGILWALGGTIATVVSMNSASNGGTYFVFWGAIVFGVIDVIRGFAGWLEYSSNDIDHESERSYQKGNF